MKNITFKGYKYEVIERPWKEKVRDRYEVIRYPIGQRNMWERIDVSEYRKIKKLAS